MSQLSVHFSQHEMEIDAPLTSTLIPIFTGHCQQNLEPIHARVTDQYGAGALIIITSAFRPVKFNTLAGGANHSQHECENEDCATDFKVIDSNGNRVSDLRPLFNGIRLESGLPIDELILEHVMMKDVVQNKWIPTGNDVIHVSFVLGRSPRRIAKEGESSNLSPYISFPFNVGDRP